MNPKFELLLVSTFINLSAQSIAGVTYMDHFDFEQRYRNVRECDPLHWYPLHLPDHCMQMYAEIIRSGIASLSPVQVMKEKSDPYSYNFTPQRESNEERPTNYEKLLNMLKKDVKKDPSTPEITVLPGLGVVAIYNQPISRKSGQYIKHLVSSYANMFHSQTESAESHIYVESVRDKGDEKQKDSKKKHKITSKDGRVVAIVSSQ